MDGARPSGPRLTRTRTARSTAGSTTATTGRRWSRWPSPRPTTASPTRGCIPAPTARPRALEISTRHDGKIDRWEWYDHGALVRSEADNNGDGKADKWETYANGAIVTVAFDENHDGRPDRRLTYGPGGKLVSIETDPDAKGNFTKTVTVKQ